LSCFRKTDFVFKRRKEKFSLSQQGLLERFFKEDSFKASSRQVLITQSMFCLRQNKKDVYLSPPTKKSEKG